MVRDLVGLAVAIAVVLDADQLAIGAPDGSVGASCEENVLAAVLAGDGGDVGGGSGVFAAAGHEGGERKSQRAEVRNSSPSGHLEEG